MRVPSRSKIRASRAMQPGVGCRVWGVALGTAGAVHDTRHPTPDSRPSGAQQRLEDASPEGAAEAGVRVVRGGDYGGPELPGAQPRGAGERVAQRPRVEPRRVGGGAPRL